MDNSRSSLISRIWVAVKILLGLIVAWLLVAQYFSTRGVDSARTALLDRLQEQRNSC